MLSQLKLGLTMRTIPFFWVRDCLQDLNSTQVLYKGIAILKLRNTGKNYEAHLALHFLSAPFHRSLPPWPCPTWQPLSFVICPIDHANLSSTIYWLEFLDRTSKKLPPMLRGFSKFAPWWVKRRPLLGNFLTAIEIWNFLFERL